MKRKKQLNTWLKRQIPRSNETVKKKIEKTKIPSPIIANNIQNFNKLHDMMK